MSDAFIDALQLDAGARQLANRHLNQCAELLPEPETWAVLGRGELASLVMLSGDTLLTVSRETPVPNERQFVVTWNRVRVTEITFRRDDQRTSWEFQFRDRGPVRIEGRMDHPSAQDAAATFDRAEQLARALAANVGWPVPEEESFPDEGLDRPSRQPVTDLWGNPKPRRRNR